MKRLTVFFGLSFLVHSAAAKEPLKPNIVFILCDDLGYGDIQALNPERCKIKTPGVDRLAKEGMIFTDSHSGSSVCTPTRYGLLTGRYSWRTSLQSGVVQGFEPCLIAPERPTVASFLKEQGYHTAIIGKWHLNFQYVDPDTKEVLTRSKVRGLIKSKDDVNRGLAPVGSEIPDGPVDRGFDYFHGFHHAGDMRGVIENDTVIAYDDVVNMLPRLTRKVVEYIDGRAEVVRSGVAAEQPFFLYVPYGSPHTPIVPTVSWEGKSGINPYADFVMETDDGVKQILEALDRNGFSENTLVIFTADNGCSKAADLKALESSGHYTSAHMRGSKSDLWDGGHRVPFLARWPGQIEPGSTSDQLVCLTDLFATCADFLGETLQGNVAEDSVSFLPALKGDPIVTSRKGVIHHSISGHFAYREGKWKLLLARGSGGWSAPSEKQALKAGAPIAQLYDLEKDPGETTNVYESQPEVAARLLAQLSEYVDAGSSVGGKDSQNDKSQIELWKSGGMR